MMLFVLTVVLLLRRADIPLNIFMTFIQCRPNVFDVGPTLYKCHTNVLCFPGCGLTEMSDVQKGSPLLSISASPLTYSQCCSPQCHAGMDHPPPPSWCPASRIPASHLGHWRPAVQEGGGGSNHQYCTASNMQMLSRRRAWCLWFLQLYWCRQALCSADEPKLTPGQE